MFPTSLKSGGPVRASLQGCIQGASPAHLGRSGAQQGAAPGPHWASLLSPLEVSRVQLRVKDEPALKEFGCRPVGPGSEWRKGARISRGEVVHGTSSETGCEPQSCDTSASVISGPVHLPFCSGVVALSPTVITVPQPQGSVGSLRQTCPLGDALCVESSLSLSFRLGGSACG